MFGFNRGKHEFVLVGLGNPGFQYENTRHNAGFVAADRFAAKYGANFKKRFSSHYSEITINGHRGLLQKPDTFMNGSGIAVRDLTAYFRIPPERVIVMHDDITLAPGRFKIKTGGSDGGHNGLKSLIEELQSWDFVHIKLGIGPKTIKEQPLADFVLQTMPQGDAAKLAERLDDVCGAVEMIVCGELEQAKAKYNHEPAGEEGK